MEQKPIHVGSVVKFEGENLECFMALLEVSKQTEWAFVAAGRHAAKANEGIFEYIHEIHPELALYHLIVDNRDGSVRVVSKKLD